MLTLAQALHHNSTLWELYLNGNDAIGEEGTCQLVQALTVNTSISNKFVSGLKFPKKYNVESMVQHIHQIWWSEISQEV